MSNDKRALLGDQLRNLRPGDVITNIRVWDRVAAMDQDILLDCEDVPDQQELFATVLNVDGQGRFRLSMVSAALNCVALDDMYRWNGECVVDELGQCPTFFSQDWKVSSGRGGEVAVGAYTIIDALRKGEDLRHLFDQMGSIGVGTETREGILDLLFQTVFSSMEAGDFSLAQPLITTLLEGYGREFSRELIVRLLRTSFEMGFFWGGGRTRSCLDFAKMAQLTISRETATVNSWRSNDGCSNAFLFPQKHFLDSSTHT